MENRLSVDREARGLVGHEALTLSGADRAAEVGFAARAELAFLALWISVRSVYNANRASYAPAVYRGITWSPYIQFSR